jgi:inositol monophosphatase 3
VISEEHERKPVDFKSIPDPTRQLDEVDEVIASDQMVPMKDVTVWIDPLDATQEYYGNTNIHLADLPGHRY